jgi:hypothetical protein
MGYFPNGTAGDLYEQEFCSRCIHRDGPDGKGSCAVMLAHLLHNYDECNNPNSILEYLIPRGNPKNGEPWNKQCELFIDRSQVTFSPPEKPTLSLGGEKSSAENISRDSYSRVHASNETGGGCQFKEANG